MAPLPEWNTPRVYVQYTQNGQEHESVFRLATTAGTAEAVTLYNAVAPAMAGLLHTSDSVTGARFSATGTNLSFPITVSPVAGTLSFTPDPDHKPNFISATGRSTDGRRVRVTMFTENANPTVDGYRMATPLFSLDTWRDAVTGATADARTISGLAPVWNPYVNIGINAYYQRKARRSGS